MIIFLSFCVVFCSFPSIKYSVNVSHYVAPLSLFPFNFLFLSFTLSLSLYLFRFIFLAFFISLFSISSSFCTFNRFFLFFYISFFPILSFYFSLNLSLLFISTNLCYRLTDSIFECSIESKSCIYVRWINSSSLIIEPQPIDQSNCW